MRITNKIIQNNSLTNMNANKLMEDRYNNQMSTGKKILRPSEDPVLAIRSLRLRTTFSEVIQYRDRNAEDADSWMTVTEDAIKTVSDIIEDMLEECNTGAVKYKQSSDRKTILDNLKQLKDEIYGTGDADYAGRGLFTGYRTATKLRFQEDTKLPYQITEKVDKYALDNITYIKMDNGKGNIGEINAGNYTDPDFTFADTDVSKETIHRLRLAYDKLDESVKPEITYWEGDSRIHNTPTSIPVVTVSKYGEVISEADGMPVIEDATQTPPVAVKADAYQYAQNRYKTQPVDTDGDGVDDAYERVQKMEDADGDGVPDTPVWETDAAGNQILDENGQPIPVYEMEVNTQPCAVFIPETGELILNDAAYNMLSATRDYSRTEGVNEGEITITYNKDDWRNGDLRPEHYFKCTEDPDGKKIEHNFSEDSEDQIISYDVGFNQELRVNTLASEVYTHAIGRDVQDIIDTLEQVQDVEAAITALTKVIENTETPDADKEKAQRNLEAANKTLTFLEEKLQVSFSQGGTRMQNHFDKATLALTEVGTRSKKLELVKERLSSQKTTFKDLIADNDQVDTAEAATNLSNAKLAYDASLMATGKITENTLLNFI